ncbi:PREDICTED: uncharacterized protein LOC109153653 isoform X1 [Ipomoea nil]|uniref:uncharacterized protein LOC109153653 isoform X1 n=1 Tax=Ipomoea nil TaxID=35883 RepID=UPI0009012AB5|nr:PREDICTED: uncharacterized protein LOC109153653 isoform X1 [Ipomoea nil]
MAAGNYYSLLNCSIVANLLLLLLLPTIYTRAAAGAVMMGGCRTAAECATAGGGVVIGEEFVMMDSETSKKLLESTSGNHPYLSYTSVLDNATACKGAVQNSCFSDKKYGKMNCGPYHRTCGGGGGS